jgi:hypothetical protein
MDGRQQLEAAGKGSILMRKGAVEMRIVLLANCLIGTYKRVEVVRLILLPFGPPLRFTLVNLLLKLSQVPRLKQVKVSE